MFQSPNSLIDDTRLQVSDSEVVFTITQTDDTKDIYVMASSEYAQELAKTKYGNPHGVAK